MRTEVRGKGEPIQLDYRLEKAGDGWKIYDVNVLGVWLVENYRNSFAQEIGASGIDGLIAKLAERNKARRRAQLTQAEPTHAAAAGHAHAARGARRAAHARRRRCSASPTAAVVIDASGLQQFDIVGARGAARMPAPGAGLGQGLRGAQRAAQAGGAGRAVRRRRPAARWCRATAAAVNRGSRAARA